MKQQINVNSKRILLSVVILSFLALNACKVTFLQGYDAKIAEQIENTSKAVDKFYLSMLDTTSA